MKININKTPVFMGKFFSEQDKNNTINNIGDSKKVLFIDTPSTEHLVNTINELVQKGIEVIIRDHHDCLDPKNPREQDIHQATQKIRDMVNNAIISTRENHPACSLLMQTGEFAEVDSVIADADLDGLLGAMKALGVVYPELDTDAAILDGPRSEQTPDKVSPIAMLLIKAMSTLPPFDKNNPTISEQAKEKLFSTFILASQGDIEAKNKLEADVGAYETGVKVANELAGKATQVAENVILVDTIGSDRYDLTTLTNSIEANNKITVIRKDFGPIAKANNGIQYSLAVVKKFQSQINLQNLLPAEFKSSPETGIISNTSFLLHVSEQIWNEQILPALQNLEQ